MRTQATAHGVTDTAETHDPAGIVRFFPVRSFWIRSFFVCAFLGAVLLMTGTARADTVVMSNGDGFTGTIISSDGKQLTLKLAYAGPDTAKGNVTLQWSAVRQVISSEPIYVVTPQGVTISGMVATDAGDLVVTPSTGAPVRIPLANAAAIRSLETETAYERSLHPKLLQDWQTTTALGFALARGNSRTTNLNFAFNAGRTTLHDKFTAYATSVYASSGLTVAPGVTAGATANAITGGARYQHDIRDRAFAYTSVDFDYNELQFLNLRSILGLGAGYHAIAQPKTKLDFFAGGNYTRESYSTGILRSVAAATVGDTFIHQWNATSINQNFEFYPQLGPLGPYRFAFNMTLATKIRAWLGWQTTLGDLYISDPIPGTVANDLIFSTGINVTFNH
jgi:hypothetical protein